MGLLVPISAERVALAFNQWCTVHASADAPITVAEALADGLAAVRAVCGSAVYPYIVQAGTETKSQPMLMSWPPPPDLRCVDCERILGPIRRPPHGWPTWESLKDVAA